MPGGPNGFRPPFLWLKVFGAAVLVAIAMLAVGGARAAEATASGDFTEIPSDPSKELRTLPALLRDGIPAAQRTAVEEHFTKYFFPLWTHVENRSKVASNRRELGLRLRNSNDEAHTMLAALTLKSMEEYAKDSEIQPVARVNAALMIGELNVVEQRGGSSAVPLPEALPVLAQLAGDPEQSDAVKVAALVGIARHFELGGVQSPEVRASVGKVALDLVIAKQQSGQSTDAHAWLQKQGADVLGTLRAVGENGQVAIALAAVVGDSSSPFYARCSAAEALGNLDYAGATGIDYAQLATPLGRLAVDAFKAEAAAQAAAERAAETTVGAGVRPGLGGGLLPNETTDEDLPILQRNRLKKRLNAAAIGLAGIASAAKGRPAENLVVTLQKRLAAVLGEFDVVQTDDEESLRDLMATIKPELEKVNTVLTADAG